MFKAKSIQLVFMVVCMMIAGYWMHLCIHEGHDWGGDFSLYISQAKALINNSVDELYSSNVTTTTYSIRPTGPYLYPFGFPILLAGILKFFGMNFFAMKVFCGMFFLLALAVIFQLFDSEFEKGYWSAFLILFIAFNYHYITFSDNVLSDLPFLCFSMLSLLFITKAESKIQLIGLGFLLFFTYMIRDVGILLIPTLFLFQLQKLVKAKSHAWKENWIVILPYLVFSFFFIFNYAFLPHGGSNHVAMLKNGLSSTLISENWNYYLELLFTYVFEKKVSSFIFYATYFLVLVGAFSKLKTHMHWVLYVALNVLILLIWPYKQGIRFIFPLLPFVLYFALQGLLFMATILKVNRYILIPFLLWLFWQNTSFNFEQMSIYAAKNTNECYTEEMKSIYGYIEKNVPMHEVIGFEKPQVLRLFTNRNSIFFDLATWPQKPANYLLIYKGYYPQDSPLYVTKLKTDNFFLLHRRL